MSDGPFGGKPNSPLCFMDVSWRQEARAISGAKHVQAVVDGHVDEALLPIAQALSNQSSRGSVLGTPSKATAVDPDKNGQLLGWSRRIKDGTRRLHIEVQTVLVLPRIGRGRRSRRRSRWEWPKQLLQHVGNRDTKPCRIGRRADLSHGAVVDGAVDAGFRRGNLEPPRPNGRLGVRDVVEGVVSPGGLSDVLVHVVWRHCQVLTLSDAIWTETPRSTVGRPKTAGTKANRPAT